ncbi:MAG: hypothetical protein VKQ33_14015 [Candidatus Sericytochromatia bacterium]|nr:hypothetical protein [Candidatus Sericytochromatia bacterium]
MPAVPRPWLPLAATALTALAVGCTAPRNPATGLAVSPGRRATPPAPVARAPRTPPSLQPTASPPPPRPSLPPGTPRPSLRPSPSPEPPAELAALPVALNAAGSIGLAAETENYLVLSGTNERPLASWSVAATDGGASAWRLQATTEAPSPPGRQDRHVAFRRWQQRQLATLSAPGRYALSQARPPLKAGETQDLWVITQFDPVSPKEVRVRAEVVEVGQHCYVLVDQAATTRATTRAALRARAAEIASTFDETVYPTNTRLFGSEPSPGIDGDPRIFILLTPAVGDYGRDTTLGYFSQRDAFATDVRAEGPTARSNARELLYVSSQIVLEGDAEDYMGTIAHEFQHMINFNQKVLLGRNRASEDLWLDEGMAMYALEACGYGLMAGGEVLANHVRQYQAEPEAYSLSDWDGNPEGIGYGPVYLLTVYLADRFGEGFIKEVVTSKGVGSRNLQALLEARGTTLTAILHDWALANLLDGTEQATDPRHQYKMLAMRGLNGPTRLSGFRTLELDLPGQVRVPGRPFTARYYRLPDGALAPRYTLTGGGSGARVREFPRLVLPEAGF